jgi:hypothetical protein
MKHTAALPFVMVVASCGATPDFNQEISRGVEEVYVARTVRGEHTSGATPACLAAPFKVANDSVYNLWSMEQGLDGRVTHTHARSAGSFRACIGSLTDGRALPMYAVFNTGGLSYSGVGECLLTKTPPPDKTLLPLNCVLNLTGLPAPYTGGILVSSTLAPVGRDQPVDAHVPGYLSTSVVITRLWKR